MSKTSPPAYRLYTLFWDVLDLLVPPHCGGCQSKGSRWCSRCKAALAPVHQPYCTCCGNPVTSRSSRCLPCQRAPPAFVRLRSAAFFRGPLQNALHRLKYRQDVGLGAELATLLYSTYLDLNWAIDAVIPVPLSKRRLRKRGYNQAALLALPFTLQAGLSYEPKLLLRTKDTPSQVGLSYQERKNNVREAFKGSLHASGKTILLIDDVTTTGSTLDACASALNEQGAAAVFGLTLARTPAGDRL